MVQRKTIETHAGLFLELRTVCACVYERRVYREYRFNGRNVEREATNAHIQTFTCTSPS